MATIREHMTPAPRAIDCHCSIAEALELMTAIGAHHLPVVERGALIGVVSERDLLRLRTLKPAVEPEVLSVGQAMSPEPYAVGPEVPLERVLHEMARRGLGCALIVSDGEVRGIFTARDALRLLAALLSRGRTLAHPG